MKGLEGFKMTEEKVRKLMPIVESIWSRKYSVDLKLNNLTVGGVTVIKDRTKEISNDNMWNKKSDI
ncbi:hypothetical protein ACIQZG_11865 [Lysinibacillus sp. NPDC096418]|uniref:hypothetical protein n=1 Tax=Lysinibacillus sp. NPDC096418 TaxID=3364138 RepID=UPI0038303468